MTDAFLTEPRVFVMRPLVANIRAVVYLVIAAWVLPSSVGLVLMGPVMMLLGLLQGQRVGEYLLGGFFCMAVGALFTYGIGSRLWEDVNIPREVTLLPDGTFLFTGWLGTLAIPVHALRDITLQPHRRGEWVRLSYQRGEQRRTLRFPDDAMVDLAEFIAAVRARLPRPGAEER